MDSPLTVLEVMTLFAGWFGASWAAWRACLASLFGLPMTEDQVATYQRHTGRRTLPTTPAREGWVLVGRRGGKSRIAAFVAVFLAVFRRYPLAPGERGVVMLIAADRKQARVVLRYVLAFFERIPALAELIERRTAEALYLTNGIVIEVHTASFRTVRGYTVVAAILDEVAFWRWEDSANPDTEILHAIRPAMATLPDALLLCITSPHARRGEAWRSYKAHYGQDGDPVQIWVADTRSMNPLVDERIIAEAYAQDEAVAAAEYGRDGAVQFRQDVETFIARETVEAAIIPDRRRLPPRAGARVVFFVDPAGGSGADKMTLAGAHQEERDGRGVVVLDVLLAARPPFSPETVVQEFAALIREYGATEVEGDRYAGEWPREQFRKHGVEYRVAEHVKSDLYREALPLLTAGTVELLDWPPLIAELCALERRTARGGRDTIDHPPHGHDDLVNAVAGALVRAARPVFSDPPAVDAFGPTRGSHWRGLGADAVDDDGDSYHQGAHNADGPHVRRGGWRP